MMYYPGRVTNCAFLIARVNNTHRWDWMATPTRELPFDADITANYHDAMANHLLYCATGIHTAAVLWGDSTWYTAMANDEVYHLVHKLITFLRSSANVIGGGGGSDTGRPAHVAVHRLAFSSHVFDAAHGKLHDVARREVISNETSVFRQCLPAGDQRSILMVRLHVTLNECECTTTIMVPPPHDNCTWDIHHMLRSREDVLLPCNSLNAVVLHVGGVDAPNDEVRSTLQAVKFKICAPIPNTQAAQHLVNVAVHEQMATPQPGGDQWGAQRTEELLDELRAMEAELVSVRAAFVASKDREAALMSELQRGRGNAAVGRAMMVLDPAAVAREQLRVSEDVLRRLNIDYVDFNRRLTLLEKAAGVTADAKVRAILFWRQQENEALLQRLSESHLHVVSGGSAGGNGAAVAMHAPAVGNAVRFAQPVHSHQQQQPSVGAGGFAAVPFDPLLQMYQGRMVELENEVARMTDVDAKALVDQYYVTELAKTERDMMHWVTRARVAEAQNKVHEQALRR